MKNWYGIRGVEYSTNFNFFKHNQIRIVRSGKNHKFCSCLESKVFLEKNSPFASGTYSETEINVILRVIHAEILNGAYGKGTLTD